MSDRPPLVVVLGASGLVGSALLERLADWPVRLRPVARRPPALPGAHAADLTEPGAVAEAVADADVVINLLLYTGKEGTWRAAAEPMGERVNVGVVRDLVAALRTRRGVPPVVLFAGSTSQAGPCGGGRLNGSEPDTPATAYDRQKLAAERLLEAATAEGVARAVTLRLPTVFGGRIAPTATDRGVVAAMARQALDGRPLTVWGDGSAERDLLHVGDAAEAFLAALDHAGALVGRHWLVGTGVGTSLMELFTTIAELAAERTGRPPVPVLAVPRPDGLTAMEVTSVVADPAAFHARTGWRARTTLREALRATIATLADTPYPPPGEPLSR
ncbi:NAD-dependent epimerase/dehydratase family protein [Spongiactinospora sp. 9N601]|uniref:NAD-dependent epimerase/dehydratase family protein n=1 Tax=Spongiactinospora sp. 9N601 TaxID=3375149 RepID=UPI0037A3A4A4